MTILRPGVVKNITDKEYTGVCDNCGCKIAFTGSEATYLRSRSSRGVFSGITTPATYEIKCPQSGCIATISVLA